MLQALKTDNSPFTEQQLRALKQSIGALDQSQSLWLSGYLAGQLHGGEAPAVPAPAAEPGQTLTVLYGSETGNGEALAERLVATAGEAGLSVELLSLDGLRPAQLKKIRSAAFIVSTHGEGDPPEEAVDLFEYLDSDRAPRLESLRYRVLALGDRSYEQYCAAGRYLDQRLEELGANRFGQIIECDVDYGPGYEAWSTEVIGWAHDHLQLQAEPATARLSVVRSAPGWSREQPFEAELQRIQKITALESDRDVYHLELSLEGSGLDYEPGDSLGVWAPNDPELVDEVLAAAGIASTDLVRLDGRELDIARALAEHREITRLSADTVRELAEAGGQQQLAAHFEGLEARPRREFIESRQLADLLAEFPAKLQAQGLLDLLRPLGPRSYSIASSQAAVDEEVHLTVATLFSDAVGIERQGVASRFLNHRAGSGARVRVFPRAESPLPPASGSPGTPDPDRRRHRYRALPRLPAAAGGRGRLAGHLAGVRQPAPAHRFPVPARVAQVARAGPGESHRHRLVA